MEINLFNQPPFTGAELRDKGIEKAITHADEVDEKWSDKAFKLFQWWHHTMPAGKQFLMEDFRAAVVNTLPAPPSLRAFGAITLMAKKRGLIKMVGYSPVSNPRAHRAYSTLWAVVK